MPPRKREGIFFLGDAARRPGGTQAAVTAMSGEPQEGSQGAAWWERYRVEASARPGPTHRRQVDPARFRHYRLPPERWEDDLPPGFEWVHTGPRLLRVAGGSLARHTEVLAGQYPAALLQRVERQAGPPTVYTFLDLPLEVSACRRLRLPGGDVLCAASPVGRRAAEVRDSAAEGVWRRARRAAPARRRAVAARDRRGGGGDRWWVRAQVPQGGAGIGHFRGPRRSLPAGAGPLPLERLDLLIPHFTAEPIAESSVGADRHSMPCMRFIGVLDLDLPLERIKLGEAPLRVGGARAEYPSRTFRTGARQLTAEGRRRFDRDLLGAVRAAKSVEDLGATLTGFAALREVVADLVAHLRGRRAAEVHAWFTGMKGFRVVWRDGQDAFCKVRWGEPYPEHIMRAVYPRLFGAALWRRTQAFVDKNILDPNKGVKTDLHAHHKSGLYASLGWEGPLRTEPCPTLRRAIRGFWERVAADLPPHPVFESLGFELDAPATAPAPAPAPATAPPGLPPAPPAALAALLAPHRLPPGAPGKQSAATHYWPPNGPATYYAVPPGSWQAIEDLLWARCDGEPAPLLSYCYGGNRPHALQLDLDKCPVPLPEVARRCQAALAAALGGGGRCAMALERSPPKGGLEFGRCTFPDLVADERTSAQWKALCAKACLEHWPAIHAWADIIDPQSRGARTHHSAKWRQPERVSRPVGCWDGSGEPLPEPCPRGWFCPLRPAATAVPALPPAAAAAAAAWVSCPAGGGGGTKRALQVVHVETGGGAVKRIKSTVSAGQCAAIRAALSRTPLHREHPFEITAIKDTCFCREFVVFTDCKHCPLRARETAGGRLAGAGHPPGEVHKDNHLYFVLSEDRLELRCNAEWHRSSRVWTASKAELARILRGHRATLFGDTRKATQVLLSRILRT